MRRHRRKRILVYALLIPTAFFLACPVFWLLILSFRPNSVIVSGLGSITSGKFVLDNYVTLFTTYDVGRYMVNSLIGTIVPSVLSVLLALLAAYALVRFDFPGRTFFYSLPLFAQVVPLIQLIVPLYVIMLALGQLDTYTAIIIAHLSLVLPLSIWMMTGYLKGTSPEIEEAAMVDGCSRIGAIFRIVIPTALPGIMATGVYAFLETWGEFLVAYLLTSKENMRLLSVAVYTFLPGAQSPTTWGILFAVAAVFMIPSLVLFVFLQRSFQQGLAIGAVTGR
ncbi:MAG: carbohydrate ABC transporter permease [Ardenticatenaceae bacterium]|nr:carbohydrate ABC transporter permease [Ardenticatenaceae bacterium]HBY93808.1 hypothetical protein [Chloroflexota bacterium]